MKQYRSRVDRYELGLIYITHLTKGYWLCFSNLNWNSKTKERKADLSRSKHLLFLPSVKSQSIPFSNKKPWHTGVWQVGESAAGLRIRVRSQCLNFGRLTITDWKLREEDICSLNHFEFRGKVWSAIVLLLSWSVGKIVSYLFYAHKYMEVSKSYRRQDSPNCWCHPLLLTGELVISNLHIRSKF